MTELLNHFGIEVVYNDIDMYNFVVLIHFVIKNCPYSLSFLLAAWETDMLRSPA
jgi:hypothetical protein